LQKIQQILPIRIKPSYNISYAYEMAAVYMHVQYSCSHARAFETAHLPILPFTKSFTHCERATGCDVRHSLHTFACVQLAYCATSLLCNGLLCNQLIPCWILLLQDLHETA